MNVGDVVEEFELEDQHGDQVSLSSLVASGPLVLYFYIKAMTPG
jgi:peroxiredoxin Q/BCP